MPSKKYLIIFLLLLPVLMHAQKKQPHTTTEPANIEAAKYFEHLRFRCIGPFRAGRCLAVAGLKGNTKTYYMGAVGGGVWRTQNGGDAWDCISDTTFHSSSVGAIAIAPSNSNIIYVGMGESAIRNNISYGDGMYKSVDGGKTWKHIGLEKTYGIATIVVNPENPDIVFAAAMGKTFNANTERGLYRSMDGGNTWKLILSKDDSTGCVDVRMDPANPNVLYASLWQAHRTPYSLSSGGPGSGLYKSTDGGNTWKLLSHNPGMPKGIMGKIICAVSPVKPQRLFAMVENANGGLFRSEDGGDHWERINTENDLTQRPWYFSGVFCDTKDADVVYVLNVSPWKSSDGGKTFKHWGCCHSDYHAMWIDPDNANNLVLGHDGGASIMHDFPSRMDHTIWSNSNIPTAQFYHVNLDNDFPVHAYGDQQDNSSVRIATRTFGNSIGRDDWYAVAGGESGFIVPDPLNSHITYGGEYDGSFTTFNKDLDKYTEITPYPEIGIGYGSIDKKQRFQWTYPIAFSPFNPHKLYICSQYVNMTTDGGQHWQIISPDLTTNDKHTQLPSGGPINKDNTGAEVYNAIFAFAESPVQQGVLWTGSDDGLVHVSMDEGKTWKDVTPPASMLPTRSMISIIDPSHYKAGTCFVAATRYKSDDNKPYLFVTHDFGSTWQLITNGIDAQAYTRAVREDPFREGLLYAGTERGLYISFNEGKNWEKFQLNLPLTPIHDMQVDKNSKNLVLATHGRSFWILDDLTPIYEYTDSIKDARIHLFAPRATYRADGSSYQTDYTGENDPCGVVINYYFKTKPAKEIKLLFQKANGDTVITYSSEKDQKGQPVKVNKDFYEDTTTVKRGSVIPAQRGFNRFVWDRRYPDAKDIEGGAILWGGDLVGPSVAPGAYTVKLIKGDSVLAMRSFNVLKDPRFKDVTDDNLREQEAFLVKANRKLTKVNEAVNSIRQITKQVNDYMGQIKDTAFAAKLKKVSQPILDSLSKIENRLVQTKAKAGQDVLKYPVMLNNKLATLIDIARGREGAPMQSVYDTYADIDARIDVQLNKLDNIKRTDIKRFNDLANEKPMDAVHVK